MSTPATSPAPPAGLLDALRAMGRTLNEILRVRGALLAVEVREEIARRRDMLLLAAIAFGFLHMALLLVTLLVAIVFWDSHRVAAVAAMAALYLGCGAAAVLRLRGDAAASPAPFAASLAEIDQDLGGPRGPR